MREFLDLVLGQLWKLTVEWPAWLLTPQGLKAVLSTRRGRHLLLLALMVGLVVTISQVMPWGIGLAYSADLVTYLDISAVATLLGLGSQARNLVEALKSLPARLRRRPTARPRAGPRGARRVRAVRRRPPGVSNDNEDGPPVRLAA